MHRRLLELVKVVVEQCGSEWEEPNVQVYAAVTEVVDEIMWIARRELLADPTFKQVVLQWVAEALG